MVQGSCNRLCTTFCQGSGLVCDAQTFVGAIEVKPSTQQFGEFHEIEHAGTQALLLRHKHQDLLVSLRRRRDMHQVVQCRA